MKKVPFEVLKYEYYCDTNCNFFKLNKGRYLPIKVKDRDRISLIRHDGKELVINYKSVALHTYYGGYFKRRRYNIIDRTKPINISNLEWASGFKRGIDYKYLKKLKDDKLSFEDLQVKNYYLTKNYRFIYRLLDKHKGLFYNIFKVDYGVAHHFNEWYKEFKDKMLLLIDCGIILPKEGSKRILIYFKIFVKYGAIGIRKNICKNKGVFSDITEKFSETLYSSKVVYDIEDKEYEDLEDEIGDMFNYFSS